MAFLMPIPYHTVPIISLILILKVIGNHSASIGSSHPTFWVSPSTFFMKLVSPSTFLMKWREDHYLETQCAHQAQQKLRNLLSRPGRLIGIGLCMAFLTPIPTISLILILKGHREPFCEHWEFTSYPTSSIRPILLISIVLTQWLFRSMLHIPASTTKSSKEPYEVHGTIQP